MRDVTFTPATRPCLSAFFLCKVVLGKLLWHAPHTYEFNFYFLESAAEIRTKLSPGLFHIMMLNSCIGPDGVGVGWNIAISPWKTPIYAHCKNHVYCVAYGNSCFPHNWSDWSNRSDWSNWSNWSPQDKSFQHPQDPKIPERSTLSFPPYLLLPNIFM